MDPGSGSGSAVAPLTATDRTPLTAAQAAYNHALSLLRASGQQQAQLLDWVSNKSTIHDVQRAVHNAKTTYEKKSKSKVRKWLDDFSKGVLYYGNIMDVLVQQHPEYVSLAWGTMKLLFVLCQNHEETLTELAKSLTKISRVLPRVEIHVNLFDVPSMQAAAIELYSRIISHFRQVLNFYEDSRLGHAWRAFARPYSLRFKEVVDGVDESARRVQELAVALSQQELRKVYELVDKVRAEQERNMDELRKSLLGKLDSVMQGQPYEDLTSNSLPNADLRLPDANQLGYARHASGSNDKLGELL